MNILFNNKPIKIDMDGIEVILTSEETEIIAHVRGKVDGMCYGTRVNVIGTNTFLKTVINGDVLTTCLVGGVNDDDIIEYLYYVRMAMMNEVYDRVVDRSRKPFKVKVLEGFKKAFKFKKK